MKLKMTLYGDPGSIERVESNFMNERQDLVIESDGKAISLSRYQVSKLLPHLAKYVQHDTIIVSDPDWWKQEKEIVRAD